MIKRYNEFLLESKSNDLPTINEVQDYFQSVEDDSTSFEIKYVYGNENSIMSSQEEISDRNLVGYWVEFSTIKDKKSSELKSEIENSIKHCAENLKLDLPHMSVIIKMELNRKSNSYTTIAMVTNNSDTSRIFRGLGKSVKVIEI